MCRRSDSSPKYSSCNYCLYQATMYYNRRQHQWSSLYQIYLSCRMKTTRREDHRQRPANQDLTESGNFPIIPDEIHKVPEAIRRAIKVGKHRKNINFSNNLAARTFNNPRNFISVASKDLDSERSSGFYSRQIITMMPRSQGDLGSAGPDELDSPTKPMHSSSLMPGGVNRLRKSEEKILFNSKKLYPIKKGVSVEPRTIISREKRNLKVTFLNVQKLHLVKVYSRSTKNQQSQEGKDAMVLSSLDAQYSSMQSPFGLKKQQDKNLTLRRSFYSKTPNRIRFRPFKAPFQRYHYRDFIWKCAYSFNIYHESPESYPQKLKVFIGRGNNSLLVKSLMKRRKGWWAFTDRYDEANLVWTQIKIDVIFRNQKSQPAIVEQHLPSCPEQLPERQLKETQKFNLKILNSHELSHWNEYFSKNRKIEDHLQETMRKRSRFFSTSLSHQCKKLAHINLKTLKMHNHLLNNYIISNKKALFYTMSRYYQLNKEDVFQYLPLTFHVQNGLEDPEYLKFLNSYYERAKRIRARERNQQSPTSEQTLEMEEPDSPSRVSTQNMWIVKPGEFTNRGNGITVCMNLQQIKAILKRKQRHDNGNLKTYIIQSYIEKPFLYQRRKFDIRHYMMIASINGAIKGYWYQLGYIRTTSFEYTVKHGMTSVHLTNDAVQKYLPEYGKYEKGNKVSYEDFQKYLDREYGGRYNFYEEIYPRMRKIATDSIRACSMVIDPEKKGHNFEIFGMDFMIDADFHPWLIEINNNPCLELSCPLLAQIIPPMVENALKICVDSVVPPPAQFQQKKPRFSDNMLETNKFTLVYDSQTEEKAMVELFSGKSSIAYDFAAMDKEEEEVFDDDGIELQD